MRFKPFLLALASALLLAASSAVTSAQVLQISGKVTLKQADGSVAPVAGAQVDIYRTDIKWEDHIKTNKKGEYMHAGVPFSGTYTIAVSAPGARPDYLRDVRLSQRPTNDFELVPGDGARLTLDQIKTANASAPKSAGNTAAAPAESKEAKAKREELERKNREIEESNRKIVESNEAVSRAFKAGNDALSAAPPRYDEAIAAYREGLAARPDEPALLTNLSVALQNRGVDRFNASLRSSDDASKTQGIDNAKKDWTDAAAAASKAVDALNAQSTAGGDMANQAAATQNKLAALTTRAKALRLVATKVDQSQAQTAWDAYQQVLAIEIDPAKKAKLRAEALQMIFDAGSMDLATAEARKVLTEDPDNVDANRILGLALFASGDKTKYQEAANYLQHYVDKAPDTDPLKSSAKESLDYLKTAENIKPEKATGRPAAGRRRQ